MRCKHLVVGTTKDGRFFTHPCGQCLQCRINDTRAWFVRSHFECKKLDRPFQYFLTLTYNEECVPDDGLCTKIDIKHFLNNLNTSFGLRMRYFATSDYGSVNNRPHYHAIILSIKKVTQKQVERIWKKGFVYLKPLNKENLKYTLRYTVKKKPFDGSLDGWFRLISKGWGDNVADYWHEGQEYFTIDGKRYGINEYLRNKLHLDKKDIVTYSTYASFVENRTSDIEKNLGTDSNFIDGLNELQIYRRRLK